MNIDELCGWSNKPDEVDKVLSTLPHPLFGAASADLPLDTSKEVFLWDYVRAVIKTDVPKGPQGIGDCVSWAWSNLVNYVACIQIFQQLKSNKLIKIAGGIPTIKTVNEITEDEAYLLKSVLEEYQECATEALYALCRCEVGGQWNSYQDGAVGAWAAKAVSTLGTLSRKVVGPYDKQRAKQWGAKGLPDDLEPTAKQHLIKTVSKVTSFEEAVVAIQNGYPVAVCSNRGFTMKRDGQGFCSPDGTWYHAMLFMANRWDRPGLCCSQSWGQNTPSGPVIKGQPDNTFWVDAKVVDYMLRQNDSFSGSQFDGYESQDLLTWYH